MKRFDELHVGEIFRYAGMLYIKIETNCVDRRFNCVNLSTGELTNRLASQLCTTVSIAYINKGEI